MAIKLGIIGTGGIMRGAHLPRLRDMKGIKIAAQCDIREEAVLAATKDFGGTPYTDFRAMLAKEKLDGVLIAVRPTDHGDIEYDCAKRGLPMFIEKPVALDPAQAKRIDKAIQKGGTFASVGYVFRYIDLVERMKKTLAGRKVALLQVSYHGPLIPNPWWYDRNQSGGQAVEQVTHFFDVIRYLFGEPKLTGATAYHGIHKKVKGYNIDDATLVTATLPGGGMASIGFSCVRKAGWTCTMEILGEGFRLFWSFPERKLTIHETELETVEQKNDGYTDELKAFIATVKDGNQARIRSTYADSIKTLALTQQINAMLAK